MTKQLHEVVIPVDPLPVWYYVFHHRQGDQYIAPHWHRGIELSYVIQGKINDFLINKTHYSSKSGKILVVNSQEIHSIRNFSHPDDLALSIIFPYEYVSHLYPSIDKQIIQINDSTYFTSQQKLSYSKLQGLLGQFVSLYFTDSDFKYLAEQNIILQALTILLRDFTIKKPKENLNERKVYVINRLQFITQYVNNHYQEPINLADIAHKANISQEYLARFFKKQMDMTVDTYIGNVRAQHAHYDLTTKKTNLTTTAINNGFSGVRTMNRAFKRLYGKSASELKQENI
ncbi:AraC family transcriptional regulator [uncultured Lactobacillus sp.]|uniref:AraC family transcriptional regulator n=1 Tax=uncultured Lactobacillus sp. TaxID=153152 RepID=UPI00261AA76D|nr:AraC family transcriptional regulator [uncultured Lactobacillus sp.]